MAKKKALFVYTGGESGDLLEEATAHWAERAIQKFSGKGKPWRILRLPDAHEALLNDMLNNTDDLQFVAMWGHGRRRDGAFLDVDGNPIVYPPNSYLLAGKSIYGMYCFSSKLFDRTQDLPNAGLPKLVLGFRDEIWLVIYPGGEAYAGFETVAAESLAALIRGRRATFSAQQYREKSSKWATHWLCYFAINMLGKRNVMARNSFLCILAFLNNMSTVYAID